MHENLNMIAYYENKLQSALSPVYLSVKDVSARHAGHTGYREGITTHLQCVIVALCFDGLTAVSRHRLIYQALASDLEGDLHALSLQPFSPKEWETMQRMA